MSELHGRRKECPSLAPKNWAAEIRWPPAEKVEAAKEFLDGTRNADVEKTQTNGGLLFTSRSAKKVVRADREVAGRVVRSRPPPQGAEGLIYWRITLFRPTPRPSVRLKPCLCPLALAQVHSTAVSSCVRARLPWAGWNLPTCRLPVRLPAEVRRRPTRR